MDQTPDRAITTGDQPRKDRATVARALSATVAVQSLTALASLTVAVLAPSAFPEIGVGPTAVGIYTSIIYVGAMTAALMSGGAVNRYGPIRVSQVSLALCALGLIPVVAGWWPLILLAALVLGCGYGPVTPASSHILARHTPPSLYSLVFSIKQTGVPLGGMLAGILVPFLVVQSDWRTAALAIATLCIAVALAVQPTRRPFDEALDRRVPLFQGHIVGPIKLVLSDPRLRILVFSSFTFSGMQQCLSVFLVTYLVHDLRWSLVQAGLALSVCQAAGIGGRILWGALADRTGRSHTILGGIGLGMTAVAIATGAFDSSWPSLAIYVVVALFGVTAIGWNGVVLAEIARIVPPAEIGRATGGTLFITFSGVVLAPPVFGAIAAAIGAFGPGYFVFAVFTAIFGVALLRRRPC